MSGLFGSAAAAATSNTVGDLAKDVAISNPPEDTVSDIAFSSQRDLLAVSSWDKKVRIYEISPTGQSEGKHMYEHDAPVLSVDWSKDGNKIVSAGADKMAKVCDLQTGQSAQVAAHDQTIKCAKFFELPNSSGPMLVTGSWDKTIKYWDLRTSNPVGAVTCQERVYTMDVRNSLLVVGTADRYINVVNLADPMKFYKTLQSPLKWQTRVVSCFTDSSGFAIGSIEGRCAIQYVEDKDAGSNFSFKCHRDPPSGTTTQVYAVNDISFHPQHGTFSTAGSDGTFHFWDKDAKHRLKGYPTVGGSITATTFNSSGNIFAYAVGYDWAKGFMGNNPQIPNKIMLHPIQGEECKPRPNVKKR
ncbi:RNA export factor gle2 [Eutypa lata]|uniref:Putative poly + rna export protein n=1 Tax=Eutypa lata (strain UCR-EL1) TaxID=1287681 RepID=M7SK38_EUTLA|nr:putative poly + rna export protein [Eutypa lata UCREL1]KAI1250450.1 RNA export factor gle2 [Eutypa lata]